jgi:predicted adenylyl cyclase CyaB
MATEIECKIPVEDFSRIEARLLEQGAAPGGSFLQEDRFFDTSDQRLLRADQGVRLRTLTRQGGGAEDRKYLLTYKGARQPGRIKQREEIELGVSDAAAMADVLQRLGFDPMIHFQKRRKRYRLADCWIELDTLPLLGRFV